MHRMSITRAFVFLFLPFTIFPVTLLQEPLPPKALNPERIQVMKDALSWMTFRKDGKLASDQDLEPFFESLKENYTQSKYFRTLIVAFKDGVLPRLTLNENDGCDPAYTLEYRDIYNNSVTYAQLKKFMFKSYDERDGNRLQQYCDYRQGLVCNQQSKKCECPQGSKMGPISDGSSVLRCLVQENEICALIDLNHDLKSKYGALRRVLPEMLFNLEKPLSCQTGTQCRFKESQNHHPSCYSNNYNGQWSKGQWGKNLGEECTLDLYAETGQCLAREDIIWFTDYVGNANGYTCYNFGPLKPPLAKQVGICAHEFGSYAITNSMRRHGSDWQPNSFFIKFVSPATTSLRGSRLRDYYFSYLRKVFQSFAFEGSFAVQSKYNNESCNVAKTEEMLSHWKFFKSLEGTPPPGEDHVANEAQLQNRLQKVADLTDNVNKKICKVFRDYTSYFYLQRALRCVADAGFVDANGNDGKCEYVPENEDVTLAAGERFKEYREHIGNTIHEKENEDRTYRLSLIGRVEIECDPKLGKPPGSEGAPTTEPGDNDVLEGGYCAPDRGCYKNYGDYLRLYDNNCNWRYGSGEGALFRDCQWMDESRKFGKCEEPKLDEKIKEELSKFSSANGLGRGDSCDNDLERRIRQGFSSYDNSVDGNKYRILWKIQNAHYRIDGEGFCDRTRLLECSEQNTCECVAGTAPRSVTFGGVEYMSDYCYVTSGNCAQDTLNGVYDAKACSRKEKEEIAVHYKGDYYKCQESNWCVYANGEHCTTENTGDTGVKPELKPVKPGPGGGKPGKPGCKGDFCDYEEATGAQKQVDVILQIISIMIILMKDVVG